MLMLMIMVMRTTTTTTTTIMSLLEDDSDLESVMGLDSYYEHSERIEISFFPKPDIIEEKIVVWNGQEGEYVMPAPAYGWMMLAHYSDHEFKRG